jgi:hypothetical protein
MPEGGDTTNEMEVTEKSHHREKAFRDGLHGKYLYDKAATQPVSKVPMIRGSIFYRAFGPRACLASETFQSHSRL